MSVVFFYLFYCQHSFIFWFRVLFKLLTIHISSINSNDSHSKQFLGEENCSMIRIYSHTHYYSAFICKHIIYAQLHRHTLIYNDDIHTPIPASSVQSCPRAEVGVGCVCVCVCFVSTGWECGDYTSLFVILDPFPLSLSRPGKQQRGVTHTGSPCADSCGSAGKQPLLQPCLWPISS